MEYEKLLENANNLLKQGQLEFAQTFCILALAQNPDSPEAWNIKGAVLMAKGEFGEALESFENAQRVGGDPRASQGIEMCRAAMGESAAPAQAGQEPSEPALTATSWFYKGEDLDKQGRSAEALVCFEKALEIDPKSAYTWYSKGVALGKLGRVQEELDSYDQALRLNSNFPEAWFNKAITLGNARRYREALECFVKAQQLGYPDAEQGIRHCQQQLQDEAAGSSAESDAWLKKGTDIVVNRGNMLEALACFEKATALSPQIERAWWGKGVALGNLGRLEEELAAYDQAIAVNPNGTGPLNSKAAALFNAGRYQEALKSYEKARELGDPQAIQRMIMCRQALGQPPTG